MKHIAIALLALLTAACGQSPPNPADNSKTTLNVVATTAMIADVAANIAGQHANVTTLMGQGVDPHLYKPTRSDIAKLMDADLILYNGLLLEGKMTDALVRAAQGGDGRTVVAVTELLDDEYLLEPEEFEGHADPHVWMDPTAWASAARVIESALAGAAPHHAAAFATNADAYAAKLQTLDDESRAALDAIPESRRVLVTAHDAFNYFGRAYDFEVVGIQGISTESEAGVRDIERLVTLLVERDIPAVFVESTVPDRNVKALIAGAAARGHAVTIGGSLYSDAMGPPDTPEGTYIGMIRHNITTIARALAEPPPQN